MGINLDACNQAAKMADNYRGLSSVESDRTLSKITLKHSCQLNYVLDNIFTKCKSLSFIPLLKKTNPLKPSSKLAFYLMFSCKACDNPGLRFLPGKYKNNLRIVTHSGILRSQFLSVFLFL